MSTLKEIIRKHRFNNNTASINDLVDFIISQKFSDIEEEIKKELKETKNEAKIEISEAIKELINKTYKGDKGDKPIAGIDYPIPRNGEDGEDGKSVDENKIVLDVLKKISKPEDGKDADEDKIIREILDKIPKPEDGKDGSPDTPEQIADKINTLEEKIEQKTIKGLAIMFRNLQNSIREAGRKTIQGGGMGNVIVETPSGTVDGSNRTFTLTTQPKTNALILTVNGQVQRINIDFTINGKIITMLWDIPTGSDIFGWFIR